MDPEERATVNDVVLVQRQEGKSDGYYTVLYSGKEKTPTPTPKTPDDEEVLKDQLVDAMFRPVSLKTSERQPRQIEKTFTKIASKHPEKCHKTTPAPEVIGSEDPDTVEIETNDLDLVYDPFQEKGTNRHRYYQKGNYRRTTTSAPAIEETTGSIDDEVMMSN